jgi:hypothetical protein
MRRPIWLTKLMGVKHDRCDCSGGYAGQPVCECKMKSVKVVNGRYVGLSDYGPAPKEKSS